MINVFRVERSKKTKTRKFPLLPRIGIVVDIGGRRLSYRQAPVLETLVNLWERGPTRANFDKIIAEQLYEIALPSISRRKTVNVKAKTILTKQKRIKKFNGRGK
ncbi:MAG: hypothetical protein HRU19_09010 [Pseudobacteriovorax sp.]|nr:hypothetical protein [Pseudobacteriovorax sp.]